jgi:hypothetical protein
MNVRNSKFYIKRAWRTLRISTFPATKRWLRDVSVVVSALLITWSLLSLI